MTVQNVLSIKDAVEQLTQIYPILKELMEKGDNFNELEEIEQLVVEGIGDILINVPNLKTNSKEERSIEIRYEELF